MSSTAADTRGHVRGDSIAQKRANAGSRSPVKLRAAGGGGGGGVLHAGDRSRGSSDSPGFVVTPTLAIRVILASLALFAILHYGPAALDSTPTRVDSADRKALMDGSGEAWILPKRWREYGAGEGPVSIGAETLPECKRVMLFKFSNTHGFSSEIMHYLRALVVAQKLGYTLLADDSSWNYGSLSEYFLPRLVYCRPPSDWFDPSVAVPLGSKRWQSKDRVWTGRQMEKEADEWVREEMLDQHAVAELKDRQFGTILPEGETLPAALEEVFTDFNSALKDVWRPNHQLAVLIRKQRMELGLGGGGLRHRKNSPNWGGRRKPGSAASKAVDELTEEEYEQEYELMVAERSDRGPVVGVHLTPPKPRLDLTQYGLASSASTGNLSAVFEGASDAVRRLTHASVASPSYSRSRPTLFPESATPTLVALTSNASLFSDFSSSPSASPFTVVRASLPPPEDLRRWNDVLQLESPDSPPTSSGEAGKLVKEWDQDVWNRDVPRALKIELTRYFVRDLTTLSQYADAFVVSGASPTGILSILLGSEEGAIGPRDFNGGSFGGRVRSVDGYWVPTSSVKGLFG
ncbi:hypothetical protein JCM10212_002554 [Sporobolomyces blumeae]